MNRQMKRMLQRQGQLGPDGAVAAPPRQPPRTPRQGGPAATRTSPGQYLRDVRSELRRVAWPTRSEVISYSLIVLVTLAILMVVIFALDFAFARGILFLFET